MGYFIGFVLVTAVVLVIYHKEAKAIAEKLLIRFKKAPESTTPEVVAPPPVNKVPAISEPVAQPETPKPAGQAFSPYINPKD